MEKELKQMYYETTVYKCSDGTTFTSRYQAALHESNYMNGKRKIEQRYLDNPLTGDYWWLHKIDSQEDWDYLYIVAWFQNISEGEYSGPGWYVSIESDGGDYANSYNVFRLDEAMNQMSEFLVDLKTLTST
jgi:hypothetical protein